SLASGQITVAVNTPQAAGLQIELVDGSGNIFPASGTDLRDGAGNLIAKQVTAPGQSGQTYLIHLHGADAASDIAYSLDIQSLTGNLETVAHRAVAGTLATGEEAYYLLSSAATGSMEVTLTPAPGFQGDAKVQLLDPKNPDPESALASDDGNFPHLSLQ